MIFLLFVNYLFSSLDLKELQEEGKNEKYQQLCKIKAEIPIKYIAFKNDLECFYFDPVELLINLRIYFIACDIKTIQQSFYKFIVESLSNELKSKINCTIYYNNIRSLIDFINTCIGFAKKNSITITINVKNGESIWFLSSSISNNFFLEVLSKISISNFDFFNYLYIYELLNDEQKNKFMSFLNYLATFQNFLYEDRDRHLINKFNKWNSLFDFYLKTFIKFIYENYIQKEPNETLECNSDILNFEEIDWKEINKNTLNLFIPPDKYFLSSEVERIFKNFCMKMYLLLKDCGINIIQEIEHNCDKLAERLVIDIITDKKNSYENNETESIKAPNYNSTSFTNTFFQSLITKIIQEVEENQWERNEKRFKEELEDNENILEQQLKKLLRIKENSLEYHVTKELIESKIDEDILTSTLMSFYTLE